jgi:hypothetical protein
VAASRASAAAHTPTIAAATTADISTATATTKQGRSLPPPLTAEQANASEVAFEPLLPAPLAPATTASAAHTAMAAAAAAAELKSTGMFLGSRNGWDGGETGCGGGGGGGSGGGGGRSMRKRARQSLIPLLTKERQVSSAA